MLAHRLHARGESVEVFGDDRANTPPVALVHLFAGRTFRKSHLEVLAFQKAVEHWRTEPLAQEWPVRRHIKTNDRLDRSLEQSEVPEDYKPRRAGHELVEYSPGFSIATQDLRERLLGELGPRVHQQNIDPTIVPGPRILALGARAPEHILNISWDLSGGRTVEVECAETSQRIEIGHGLHIAPRPDVSAANEPARLVLGGRSSATGPGAGDEVPAAAALTGLTYEERESWQGKRCAPAADRWPVLGHKDPETFLFCGFGSRALFWLPACLDLAVCALLDPSQEADIPLSFHWRRFRPDHQNPRDFVGPL